MNAGKMDFGVNEGWSDDVPGKSLSFKKYVIQLQDKQKSDPS